MDKLLYSIFLDSLYYPIPGNTGHLYHPIYNHAVLIPYTVNILSFIPIVNLNRMNQICIFLIPHLIPGQSWKKA